MGIDVVGLPKSPEGFFVGGSVEPGGVVSLGSGVDTGAGGGEFGGRRFFPPIPAAINKSGNRRISIFISIAGRYQVKVSTPKYK